MPSSALVKEEYIKTCREQQLEAELQQAYAAVKAAIEAKNEFLRNMSHEFRTPLHGMANFAEFGVDGAETEDRAVLKMFFKNIAKVTMRLTELTESVLNISKMEDGSEEFDMSKADILEIFEIVTHEQQNLFKQKQVQLHYNKPDFNTGIVCHRGKIIQLIANILNNAAKFTPKGKKVTLSAKQYDGFVTISIEDEGVGIPQTELTEIFRKFFIGSRTKTYAGGTGLGLAVCAGIVRAHNGHIWAENNAGGGATINFTISTGVTPGKKIMAPVEL